MEVSVFMKNGHKCDFFNVEEKYPMFKMKNIWIADFKSDTKEYLNDIDEHCSQMYVTVYLHIWNV